MPALYAATQHMKQNVVLFVVGRNGAQTAVLTATSGSHQPASLRTPHATLPVAAFRTARPVRNRANCIVQQSERFRLYFRKGRSDG